MSTLTPESATQHLHTYLLTMDREATPSANTVRGFLASGADVNAPDVSGTTPLLRCLSMPYDRQDLPTQQQGTFRVGLHDVLDVLLAHGAGLGARTPYGEDCHALADRWTDGGLATGKIACETYRRATPALATTTTHICTSWPKPGTAEAPQTRRRFIAACARGHEDEARYLLHLYPDAINWNDDSWQGVGSSGLMAALEEGHLNIARLLIAQGCDVNWQNSAGNSALHSACMLDNGANDLMDDLLTAGADPTLTNNTCETPAEAARAFGMSKNADRLEDLLHQREEIKRLPARVASKNRKDIHRKAQGGKFKL